jgi:hypothetical protein
MIKLATAFLLEMQSTAAKSQSITSSGKESRSFICPKPEENK